MEGVTIEGVSFNVEFVQSFKTSKEYLKEPTNQTIFNDFSKEDKESLLKKVWEECHSLKKAETN